MKIELTILSIKKNIPGTGQTDWIAEVHVTSTNPTGYGKLILKEDKGSEFPFQPGDRLIGELEKSPISIDGGN